MKKSKSFLQWAFTLPWNEPELARAQMRAFSKQIPLLYFVLLSNAAFLSVTHYSVAPFWLTVALPSLFGCFAALRVLIWWRSANREFTGEEAIKRLRSFVTFAGSLGILMTCWCFGLLSYGGAQHQSHVVFFMAVTLIACVFCLMHMRAAAFLLTIVVTVPFTIQLLEGGDLFLLAISANMVMVISTMLVILSKHYDDFATMVSQKVELEKSYLETKRLSDDNFRLANIDSLTGLPNRRSFIASLEAMVADNAATQKTFAVGLIDLDGFKAVNDLYGHAAGDALLVEASDRMRLLQGNDIVFARLGGDEFGFLVSNDVDVAIRGLSICEALRAPYVQKDVSMEITASCGISRFPASATTVSELLEFADYALYQAKLNAAGTAVLFSSSHGDQLRISHQVDQALRSADLAAEMSLFYQPVVDQDSGTIVSFEALARWSSGLLGQVPPGQFIATAERSPLINKVTLVLLEKLLAAMKTWPHDLQVSFNLSARSLASSDAMLRILNLLHSAGIDHKRIEFEVTETALMIDFEATVRALQLLRNLGCSVALDDFGTGYSSLSYVQKLPLDKIKIDRRFISEITLNQKTREIVQTMLDLAKNLNLTCVAEGVETQDQADMLAAMGCRQMQGFLFSVPVPAHHVPGLLAKREPLTAAVSP